MRSVAGLFVACSALLFPVHGDEEVPDPFETPGGEPLAVVVDPKAWNEWVTALSKAEEIEVVAGRYGKVERQVRRITDRTLLKELSAEISGSLEVDEVTENEEVFEIRIKNFKPKHSARLWVASPDPGNKFNPAWGGEIFQIQYTADAWSAGDESIVLKDGKVIPALNRVLHDACKAWELNGLLKLV